MASNVVSSSEGVNGINLANYFPSRRTYNSVVYIHKRFLSNIKEEETKDIKKVAKPDKNKRKKKMASINVKLDKSQQFNSETMNRKSFKCETVEMATNNNFVLDQTVRFAKNLVPLLIPKESSPVYYTIKSTKKHRKRDKNPRESSIGQDITYNKDKFDRHSATKSHKNRNKGSLRETINSVSQNTLDDLQININQSCSFSESTEVKFHKKTSTKNEGSGKFQISNSFEALASESLIDGNKIKVHLMNDADKILFSESIQNPIINTIKDYMTTFNINSNKVVNTDLKIVENLARTNAQKLDDILEKLTCIQKRIDIHAKTTEAVTSKVPSASKASILEEIGQDTLEVGGHMSEEDDFEEYNNLLKRRKNRGKTVVVDLEYGDKNKKGEKEKDSLGCGEEIPDPLKLGSAVSKLGVKPDRPNKIPARLCWTDSGKKI